MAGTGEIVKSLENANNCDFVGIIPNMKAMSSCLGKNNDRCAISN